MSTPNSTFLAIDYDTLNEWYFFIGSSLVALLAVYIQWPILKNDWQRKKWYLFYFYRFIGFLMIFLFTLVSLMFFEQGSFKESTNLHELKKFISSVNCSSYAIIHSLLRSTIEELLFRGYLFSEMKRLLLHFYVLSYFLR